ncbi:MAG TPA: type II secretion system minor pseudopilin GspK [Steroidobacteraceae bacterium]|jgi:general secretion pathway protein K|nr:type II secretion system minor pseudopilin GspK [Steroidobacteraceae bacterium]
MRSLIRQGGVALITAIILVAIAAVLATAIGYASAMSARRASTQFGSDQSFLAAQGAEAMAAYVLRLSTQNNAPFSLDQPWAQAYGPFELTDGVTMELLQLEDEQSKFNINNLAPNGSTNQDAKKLFEQILQLVGLETKWAGIIADWIDSDNEPNSPDGAEDSAYTSQTPPYRTANIPITSISELLALPGFGRARYDRIAPYITALPPGSDINICTTSGLILDAIAGKVEYSSDPDALANERKLNGCFPKLTVFQSTLQSDAQAQKFSSLFLGSSTSYFRLRSFITIGSARFTLYSLLYRDNSGQMRPILRTFGTE